MAILNFPPLPAATGTQAEQLSSLHAYIAKLQEQLQYGFSNLDGDNQTPSYNARMETIARTADGAAKVTNDLSFLVSREEIGRIVDRVDGKNTIYYQPEEPPDKEVGDIWYDTDDVPNTTIHRWTGVLWADITTEALSASLAAAADARAIADGKIKTFVTLANEDSKPPIYNPEAPDDNHARVGDLLMYGKEDNALYRCDGVEWKLVQNDETKKYIRQTSQGLEIGELTGIYKVVVTPTGILFRHNDAGMARYENDNMFAAEGTFEDQVILGKSARGTYYLKSGIERLTVDYKEKGLV